MRELTEMVLGPVNSQDMAAAKRVDVLDFCASAGVGNLAGLPIHSFLITGNNDPTPGGSYLLGLLDWG